MWIKNILIQLNSTITDIHNELHRSIELLAEVRNRTHWLSQDVKELRKDLDIVTKDCIKQTANTVEKPKETCDYSYCNRSRIAYCHTCNKNSEPHY